MTTPLLLVVEIVSPSSRSVDLLLKRNLCEEAGVRHCRVVDPGTRQVLAWTLTEGRYGEPAAADHDGVVTLDAPFRVTLDPLGCSANRAEA